MKVDCGSENSLGALSTAVYSTLLAAHNEFKSLSGALMLECQCIPRLAEEAKKLRAKVADIKKFNALPKSTSNRKRNKKRPTVAGKCVNALEAK